MKIVSLLFFISLLFGTISGLSLSPGVTIYIHDVVFLIFFVASAFSIFKKNKRIQPKLLIPIAGFVGIAILSLCINSFRFTLPQTIQSSLYLVRWAAYVGIYIIVVERIVPATFILEELFMTGVGFGVLGLLQYVFFPSLRPLEYLGWDPHYFRLFSTLLDPNFAGIMLVLSIFLGIYLFTRFGHSKLIVCCLGILLIALYLTYSRSSYLAFSAGFIFLAVRSVKWKARGVAAVLLFLLAVVLLPTPGGKTLRLDRMASTISRLENWQESISRISGSPVIGYGFNTLRFIPSGGDVDMFSKAAAGVDNSILFILLTTGIAGLAVYSWLVVREIGMVREIGKKQKILGDIFLASLIVVVMHSMFVNSLFYPWVMIWMWTLTGAIEQRMT